MEALFSQMTIRYQALSGGLARHSWLRLVTGAIGLLALAPGFAWALGEDTAGYDTGNGNPPAEQAQQASENRSARGDTRLLLVPCPACPTFGSDALDSQASAPAPTTSASSSDLSPVEDEKQRLKVNPLTGLGLASESDYTPLTGNERWKLYLKMTYASAGPYLSPLVNASLLDQANGTPRQWGRGFPGFERRLASRVGNAVLQGTFQAPFAAILHEDVRYIPTNKHSFQRRALHAILYSFLTYNGKGQPTLNIGNLAAFYASTAVTTVWLPGVRNAARYTLSNGSEQIALSFPLNVVQEFWPEISRHLFHRH